MKTRLFTILASVLLSTLSLAQSPEGFKYQAVIRDVSGAILVNQAVGIQMTIHQTTASGTAVYTETFSATTNNYGLVNLEIGTGTTMDDFSAIDWASGPYFIETAADLSGGTMYSSMGTSQLMSVPYALYAKTAPADSDWEVTGNNMRALPTGNISMGQNANLYNEKFTIGDTGLFRLNFGHAGNFNEVESGRLAFTEDVDFVGTCGFEFHHDGVANTLSLESGCPLLEDTAIVFTRTGEVRIPERVKIGENSNPSADIHIKQSSEGTSPVGAGIRFEALSTTDRYQLWNGGGDFNFGYNGTRISYITSAGTYTQVSDRRLKENIVPMGGVLEKVLSLRPVEYNYNFLDNAPLTKGFIAQEVQEVFPEMVSVSEDTKMLALPYDEFSVIAVKAIQEQQEIIEKQQEEINALKASIKELQQVIKIDNTPQVKSVDQPSTNTYSGDADNK